MTFRYVAYFWLRLLATLAILTAGGFALSLGLEIIRMPVPLALTIGLAGVLTSIFLFVLALWLPWYAFWRDMKDAWDTFNDLDSLNR